MYLARNNDSTVQLQTATTMHAHIYMNTIVPIVKHALETL